MTFASETLPSRVHDLLLSGRAVVVQNVDRRLAGNIGDRADAPDLESADVVFAAHIEAVERRRRLAAVAGDEPAQEVHADHVAFMKPGRKYLASIVGSIMFTLPPRKLPANVHRMQKALARPSA